ncbi:MAG: LytR/AlgR family response regulator transcription factor [Fluviicola sp.]|jgi:two-component system response regulator LytT
MNAKILVVEDEIIIADNICEILRSYNYETLEPALSFEQANRAVQELKPDIVILDINLKGKKTGFDFANEVLKTLEIPFLYLTSNSDFPTMKEAIATNPSAFLVKPFNESELIASIEIIYNKLQTFNSESHMYVFDGKEYINVLKSSILFIKSDNIYIEFFINNGTKIISRSSLKKVNEELDSDFIQIHRSYIVNLKHIEKIASSEITIDKTKIPIGEKYATDFKNIIKLRK